MPAAPVLDHQPTSAPPAADSHQLLSAAADEPDPSIRKRLEDRVIVANRPVARNIAQHYLRRGIDPEDIQAIAQFALVKAVRSYRPDRGQDFLNFAVPTIRGEIRRYFRDHGWLVRPPRRLQEPQPQIRIAEQELSQVLAREPTLVEIAAELNIEEQRVRDAELARGCFHAASLEVRLRRGYGDTWGNAGPGSDADPDAVENRLALRPLVAALSARDRTILRLRFVDDCTQEEIGAVLGVSQMHVSRCLTEILAELRRQLADCAPRADAAAGRGAGVRFRSTRAG